MPEGPFAAEYCFSDVLQHALLRVGSRLMDSWRLTALADWTVAPRGQWCRRDPSGFTQRFGNVLGGSRVPPQPRVPSALAELSCCSPALLPRTALLPPSRRCWGAAAPRPRTSPCCRTARTLLVLQGGSYPWAGEWANDPKMHCVFEERACAC